MGSEQAVLVVLRVALIALTGTGIWLVIVLGLTARSAKRLIENLDTKLPPLLDKAGEAIDSVNSEMVRVDGLVTQLEEVSDKVTSTTRAASEIVGAPVAAVVGVGARVRRFFSLLLDRQV